ncbi:MAG: iron-sulfur cluster assembly scaffold protein [Candidatus Bathyarchaeia archaeon]
MNTNTNNNPSGSDPKKTPKKLSDEELKLMAESGYSKKAIDLYVNKVNMGPLENPSVITTFLGQCGDLIRLYLQISNTDKIENASFYYLGCPGSATSASAMTTLLKGMTVKQAKQLTEDDIVKELGGLPKSKSDCTTLSITTLRKAIAEYEKQKGRSEI